MKIKLYKNNNHLRDNDYSLAEEEKIFSDQLHELYHNPRWYLENLEFMQEYRVSWGNYRKPSITCPRREEDDS